MLREGDVPKARELTDRALELLSERDGARFAALTTRTSVEWAIGDLDEHECIVREALALARELESKHMESDALLSLVSNKIARLRLDDAEECLRQAIELAEETGSTVGRGVAFRFLGVLQTERGELDEAAAALEESMTLLAEADAAWSLGRAQNYAAWVARRQGKTERGREALPRVDQGPEAARGSRHALRERSGVSPSCSSSSDGSTRRRGLPSLHGRRWGRRT